VGPADHLGAGTWLAFVAAIDDEWLIRSLACQCRPRFEHTQPLALYGLAGFDLDRTRSTPSGQEHVDFRAVCVLPEMEVGCHAAVQPNLVKFRDHEGLEQGASQGMAREICGASNAEQRAGKTRVPEVEFGRLGQALAQVDVTGSEHMDGETGLEHG
jgi:hypothetical protein